MTKDLIKEQQEEYSHKARHVDILNMLEAYKKSNPTRLFTTKEIAREVKKGISIIVRDVKELYDIGCIKRYLSPAGGHVYVYSFASYLPTKRKLKKRKEEINHVEFTAESIGALLQRWSKEPWRPKIFNSARNLPQGIAEIYKMALEAKYGAAVDQADINVIRESLNIFRQDLINALGVVDGLLLRSELWNKTTLPLFLLPDIDEELIQQQLDDIVKNN